MSMRAGERQKAQVETARQNKEGTNSRGQYYDRARENNLVIRYAHGESELRDEIVIAYQELIKWAVRSTQRNGHDDDDLIQVGNISLMRALDNYDPARGVTFRTFAGTIIKHDLWDYLSAYARLKTEPLTTTIVINRDGVEEQTYEIMPQHTPDHYVAVERRFDVMRMMRRLPMDMRRVLYLYYYEKQSQTAIGEQLGLSQMTVSRLLTASVDRLRALNVRL